MIGSDSKYTFLKEEHFNCIKESFEEINVLRGEAGATGVQALFNFDEYKPVPWYYHVLGFVLLFLEGYVLSILFVFVHQIVENIRKREYQ